MGPSHLEATEDPDPDLGGDKVPAEPDSTSLKRNELSVHLEAPLEPNPEGPFEAHMFKRFFFVLLVLSSQVIQSRIR